MPKKSRSSRTSTNYNLLNHVNNSCMPAYLYFYISLLAIIVLAIQNIGNKHMYCAGPYECSVPDTTLVFIMKLIYIIFWTWILSLICKAGYSKVAWFIFLFPVILMLLMMIVLLFR